MVVVINLEDVELITISLYITTQLMGRSENIFYYNFYLQYMETNNLIISTYMNNNNNNNMKKNLIIIYLHHRQTYPYHRLMHQLLLPLV